MAKRAGNVTSSTSRPCASYTTHSRNCWSSTSIPIISTRAGQPRSQHPRWRYNIIMRMLRRRWSNTSCSTTRFWASPGMAPVTAAMERSGEASSYAPQLPTVAAWPASGHSRCRAEQSQCANRGAVAVALVYQAAGPERTAAVRFPGVAIEDIERLVQLLARPRLWPVTSSAGRLFDGIAALALNIANARYDAHPAMLLEAACDESAEGEYRLPLTSGKPATLDWRGIVARVLADRDQSVAPGTIAMRFHRALAGGIAAVVEQNPGLPVVLCGGCFQNRLLTELVVERLSPGHQLFTPGIIPTGDGGLAAGQLAIAAAPVAQGWRPCA